jgi:drug/metabolite transporter (DMT)-like permease
VISLTYRPALSANMQGVLWMLLSGLAFTVMTVCIKFLALRDYSESQMLFFRCAAGVVLLAPAMIRGGASVWSTPRPFVMARRCIGSALGVLLAFYAVAHMPLATAQSLSFVRPLFVVLLAMLLLHEKVGVWRRGALIVGFVGVMVMLRPNELRLDLPAFASLASALLLAYTVVTIKDLSRDHTTLSLVVWMNAATTVLALPLAFSGWRNPGLMDAGVLALLSVAGVIAQTAFTRGLTSGDASFMTLMDYTRLPMAVIAGLIVFHEVLDLWTVLGATIVIASTIFITVREAYLEKRRDPPPIGPS